MNQRKQIDIPLSPSEEEIEICAYLIWEQEGQPEGRDKVHWEQAEEQLIAAYAHDRWTCSPLAVASSREVAARKASTVTLLTKPGN